MRPEVKYENKKKSLQRGVQTGSPETSSYYFGNALIPLTRCLCVDLQHNNVI